MDKHFHSDESLETSVKDTEENYDTIMRMDEMEIDDSVFINKKLTMDWLITDAASRRKKQPFPCLSVCLGLLCVLLLAGNIGQFVFYEIIRGTMSADPTEASEATCVDQLQSNNDSFIAERQQLEARMTKLTNEKDQLQQSLNSLTTERDEFKNSLDNLKTERDQFRTSYTASKNESNRLQISYDNMQRNLKELQTNYSFMVASKELLQSNYRSLKTENNISKIVFNQLQSNYTSLKTDKDQLQRRYNTLDISKNMLQIGYSSLVRDKEQLQTRHNTARIEIERLKTNYSSLAAGRDQLQKKIDKVRRRLVCQKYWSKFDISCYYVSTLKMNWTMSRMDCIKKGADLVVIDSREEQAFVHSLLKPTQNAWIGLTDSVNEGVWTWVDGSPATTFYWQANQPNSFGGNQDCVELLHESQGVGEWNDDGCFAEQNWICQK